MQFIYCFDEVEKVKLIKNGYKFLGNKQLNNQVVFLFANNGKKIDFNKEKIGFTNQLHF